MQCSCRQVCYCLYSEMNELYTRNACSYKDFCVRDHVLPFDAQNNPHIFCMEVVELSVVTAVHNP